MALDIVYGTISKPRQTTTLLSDLQSYFSTIDGEATVYLGYPLTASSESKVTIDAMLVSEQHGLIAFIFQNTELTKEKLDDEQDELYYHLDFYLKKYPELRIGRHSVITPLVITITANGIDDVLAGNFLYCKPENIYKILDSITSFKKEYYNILCSVLQKVTNIRPKKKRDNIKKTNSKGYIIKEIEKEIANLDIWQKKAALEIPEGPQRIRGLAGTGKTIVLALKAAYLHTQHPDWKILVTFYTRSLKQQYVELVEKFVQDFSNEKPDREKLIIAHSWGSLAENGVYFSVAKSINAPTHTYSSAINAYGRHNTFEGICSELLSFIKENNSIPQYDAILIDEGQDLPSSFFKILYKCSKSPKRIIWAYDELQNLSDVEMPSIKEMFGIDSDGNSVINIENQKNEPQRDIILPVCYRNPPWTLALAHALGFGIYNTRRKYPVQAFEDPKIWNDIGYSILEGKLETDHQVRLERSKSASPDYFDKLLYKENSINNLGFKTKEDQYAWVANDISKNLNEEELDPDDILIIFPEAKTSKIEYTRLSQYLRIKNIDSILAGVSSSQDTFRTPGCVTCSGIYRAKGNESPLVYILNSEYCDSEYELIKRRNILFTAITRSRAWVNICGVGSSFDHLHEECNTCIDNDFKLAFRIPNSDEIKEIRKLNKERTTEEIKAENDTNRKVEEILEYIKNGQVDPNTNSALRSLIELITNKTNE